MFVPHYPQQFSGNDRCLDCATRPASLCHSCELCGSNATDISPGNLCQSGQPDAAIPGRVSFCNLACRFIRIARQSADFYQSLARGIKNYPLYYFADWFGTLGFAGRHHLRATRYCVEATKSVAQTNSQYFWGHHLGEWRSVHGAQSARLVQVGKKGNCFNHG